MVRMIEKTKIPQVEILTLTKAIARQITISRKTTYELGLHLHDTYSVNKVLGWAYLTSIDDNRHGHYLLLTMEDGQLYWVESTEAEWTSYPQVFIK